MLLNFVRFNPIKKKKEANLTYELTCKHCKKKQKNQQQQQQNPEKTKQLNNLLNFL